LIFSFFSYGSEIVHLCRHHILRYRLPDVPSSRFLPSRLPAAVRHAPFIIPSHTASFADAVRWRHARRRIPSVRHQPYHEQSDMSASRRRLRPGGEWRSKISDAAHRRLATRKRQPILHCYHSPGLICRGSVNMMISSPPLSCPASLYCAACALRVAGR